MALKYISGEQLKRLHTLWSMYARHELIPAGDRNQRLAWIILQLRRHVDSTKELTFAEANTIIDTLQRAVGQPARKPSRPRSKNYGGKEGRRGNGTQVVTVATAEDLARIQDAITRLSWDQATFEKWLRSPSSPLRGRANPKIHTVADANRVWWAMKALLKRAGKWQENRSAEVAK